MKCELNVLFFLDVDQIFEKDPSSEDEFDDAVSQIILSDDEEDEVGLEYQSAIDWDSYSDSEEEDDSSFQTKPVAVEDGETAVKNKIAEWVVSCRIPHLHVNSLLRILKTEANLQYLPLDTRTLLKSKRGKLTFIDVPPGKYYHIGVEQLLISFLLELKSQGIPIPNHICLFFNVDGIPLSSSSSSEFWPILFRVVGECEHNNNLCTKLI